MAGWLLSFAPKAERDFDVLDKKVAKRVIEKLEWLRENFDSVAVSALGGEWSGCFKLRIGDWRVVYKVDWENNHIIVYVVDRRDRVYKRRK